MARVVMNLRARTSVYRVFDPEAFDERYFLTDIKTCLQLRAAVVGR